MVGMLFSCFIMVSFTGCKKTTPASPNESETTSGTFASDKIVGTGDAMRPAAKSAIASITAGTRCDAAGAGTQWGNPGSCDCPAKFLYNPVSGLCDGYEPIPAGSSPTKNVTVSAFVPPGTCTNDLNEWNNPSQCDCPPRSWYNPVSARCDTK